MIQLFNPQLYFKGEKSIKVVGDLAKKIKMGSVVSGVIVKKNFDHIALDSKDLFMHTGLPLSTIHNKQKLPFLGSLGMCQYHMHMLAGKVKVVKEDVQGKPLRQLKVFDSVTVTLEDTVAVIEWVSSELNDFNADLVLQCLLNIQRNILQNTPKTIEPPAFGTSSIRRAVLKVLDNMYGAKAMKTESAEEDVVNTLIGSEVVRIDLATAKVICSDEDMQQSLSKTIQRIKDSTLPIPYDPLL